mmetsp:Transcript_4733/g.12441  ORF Transcript_4733/g.12441 Transcript_4733/m.12441 type:complete len:130 (+) Transcript_4733:597-986(+)
MRWAEALGGGAVTVRACLASVSTLALLDLSADPLEMQAPSVKRGGRGERGAHPPTASANDLSRASSQTPAARASVSLASAGMRRPAERELLLLLTAMVGGEESHSLANTDVALVLARLLADNATRTPAI